MHAFPTRPQEVKSPGSLRRWQRRGAAAVEFAIVAPLLVALVLGLIEFGRVLMVGQILTNAAREGCRTAVLEGSTTTDVNTTVSNYLTGSGISGAPAPTVSPDPSSAAPGSSITVTVSVPFNNVSWLPVPLFMGGKTLSATVIMRKESNNT
jgi:Flp pilus assembly protein TadG